MEPNSPWGIFTITASLLFVAYLVRGFVKSLFQAKEGIDEIGHAFVAHIGNVEKAKKRFFLHPWTEEEANVMLQELHRQLATRSDLCRSPEFAVLGRNTTDTLLTLAVFTKIVLSTEEIRQRIAFLETLMRRARKNPTAQFHPQLS